MAIVDFSEYTEVDPSSEITVTSTKIDVVDFALDERAYVTKDYGANYFENFVFRQKIHFESATASGGADGACVVWSLAPVAYHTQKDIFDALDGLMIEMATVAGGALDVLNLRSLPGNDQDFYTIPSVPVDLWLEIERAGTTLTCKIYSDAYSTLIETLSVVCSTDTMRWHNAIASLEVPADDDTITAYVENFDIVSMSSFSAIIKVGTATYADASKVAGVLKATIGKIAGISV